MGGGIIYPAFVCSEFKLSSWHCACAVLIKYLFSLVNCYAGTLYYNSNKGLLVTVLWLTCTSLYSKLM